MRVAAVALGTGDRRGDAMRPSWIRFVGPLAAVGLALVGCGARVEEQGTARNAAGEVHSTAADVSAATPAPSDGAAFPSTAAVTAPASAAMPSTAAEVAGHSASGARTAPSLSGG